MPLPKFTISIVCYNNLDLTKLCIASVQKFTSDYELIITNNASTDGTKQCLTDLKAKLGRQLTVVTNESNLGFIAPNRNALRLAKGEFFVLLNNDMEVCENWTTMLSEPFATNPKLAITGNRNTFGAIDSNLKAIRTKALEYIEGSLLMIPTWIARKHGLFSDYLQFAYWEDTDLSFRLREFGYDIQTVALPGVTHQKRGSTSRTVPGLLEVISANTAEMKKRWGFYFKRRTLDRRILIRRLGARGDVLLLTPALKALRNKYPNSKIEIITKCPEMLRDYPGLSMAMHAGSFFDEIYDLDLSYEARPDLHIVQAYCQALDVPYDWRWKPELFPTAEETQWAQRISRGGEIALIHAGPTTWPGKNWPVERMGLIVSELKKRGLITFAVGADDSPSVNCDETLAGRTTPQALYALARHAKLFVGIDSMPQHVATAADCPSVVLFGPTNPSCIVRPSPKIIAVQASRERADCVGAHGRRVTPSTQAPCDGECIRAITIPMVKQAIDRALRSSI